MSQELFKYKSDNELSIDDLINSRLWVSSLLQMNDPVEFGFFVEKEMAWPAIVDFQNALLKMKACLSFSTSRDCKRLWNYYTNGMRGYVVEYTDSSIREALATLTISTIKYDAVLEWTNGNRLYKDIAFEGNITYGINEKIDLTSFYKAYIEGIGASVFIENKDLFNKDESWKDEEEYRFMFDFSDQLKKPEDDGFYLQNLKPEAIYIGYRMNKDNVIKIQDYCYNNSIPLYRYSPDFLSPNKSSYFKECLFDPKEPNTKLSIERIMISN